MSDQLQMFEDQNYQESTPSPSEALARISHLLETVKGWQENEAALSLKQLGLYKNADLVFLYGKMLKELSPQMLAKTLRQSCKRLPTLGAIDLNGNCLIRSGFYPKIERESTLSDMLQQEVQEKYFLSQKALSSLKEWQEKGEESACITTSYHKGVNWDNQLIAASRGRGSGQPVIVTKPVQIGQSKKTFAAKSGTEIGKENQDAFTIRSSNPNGVLHQQTIRRLTPIECERLQGFPDNWTLANGISDTQRYKMCGNAVTVDVVEAVGKRILETVYGCTSTSQ